MSYLLATLAMLQAHPVRQIDSIVTSGVHEGVYPGAVVVVGTADSILLSRGFGSYTWTSSERPDPDSTLYDLASLTKVVATTSAVLLLVERGKMSLDDPLERYVPDFIGADKPAVTVRQVMTHQSGMRAFLPLNTTAADAIEARRLVVTEPLRWRTGSRVVYSDLNAMLAGWAVEGAAGESLREFVERSVFRPLGMTRTQYGVPDREVRWAAPINLWRGHPIAGVIHDQNAEKLGGVSGHAGVYSTGMDLARLSQWYLRRGVTENGTSLASPENVQGFIARSGGNRAVGWEMRDTTSSDNAGTLLSVQTFGHTGFTGTSIWIDPVSDVFVVLLTNRVMAPRHRASFSALKHIRGQVADAAFRLRQHACRISQMASEQAVCTAPGSR